MTRGNYIILSILSLSMIVSAFIVRSSPAYSQYRSLSSRLDSQLADFRHHVDSDVLVSVSNLVDFALSRCLYSDVVPSSSSSFLSTNILSSSFLVSDSSKPVIYLTDFRYNYARLNDYKQMSVYLNGWEYVVGDSFLDSTIVKISPSCVVLSDGTFVIPQSLKEVNKL